MKLGKMFLMLAVGGLIYMGSVQNGVVSIGETATAAPKLGDLSKFKKIAVDTQTLVGKGDLAAAKVKIKNLETTWDESEAGLKPRSAKEWHVIDKAIDHALEALNEGTPKADTCKKAVDSLVKSLDSL